MCPRAKVTIDSLHEVVYEKSIGTKMNDLDLCLEVVSRSRKPLRYIQIIKSNHLFESGDMAHTQALTHTHTIHNNTKEGK